MCLLSLLDHLSFNLIQKLKKKATILFLQLRSIGNMAPVTSIILEKQENCLRGHRWPFAPNLHVIPNTATSGSAHY